MGASLPGRWCLSWSSIRRPPARSNGFETAPGKQAQVGWGSQIRSYVLQPYQMVKDLRTDVETANVSGVLDGDIDDLIEGYLRWRRAQGEQS